MEADGIEVTMVMLNSVLNSFSVAAKPEEGLSVLDYMLQNVSSSISLDSKWV
jgi:pentatricopeptide repeat protein